MNELRRIVVADRNESITILVRPNGNTLLTLLVGAELLVILLIAGTGAYVLWHGGFSLVIWLFYAGGLGSMVLVCVAVIFWNVAYTKVIRLAGGRLTIETNGVRKRRELPVSGFRVAGPSWPYNVDTDYEFLGLGIWSVEAYGPGGTAKLITRLNRHAAKFVAGVLRAKGFPVDAPFPASDPA